MGTRYVCTMYRVHSWCCRITLTAFQHPDLKSTGCCCSLCVLCFTSVVHSEGGRFPAWLCVFALRPRLCAANDKADADAPSLLEA